MVALREDPVNAQNKNLWLDSSRSSATRTSRASLTANLEADVVVVGAGIAGLTTALQLIEQGKRVVVVEANAVGAGESLRTTSHLTYVLDQRFHELAKSHGDEATALIAEGHREAIDQIESYVKKLGVDCGFLRVDGYLFAAADDKQQQEALDKEWEACRRLELGAHRVDGLPEHALRMQGALKFPNQAQLSPAPYLAALAKQIETQGGYIFEGVRVLDVEHKKRCEVATERGVLLADQVVVCSHTPIHTKLQFHATLENLRTYVVAKPWPNDKPVPLLWDLETPYHYIRTQQIENECFLIVGGRDHKVGEGPQDDVPYRRLSEYMALHWGGGEPTHRWSGQILETTDGLPYIGATTPASKVLLATGFSGNGYTNGTLAAMVLSDIICGRPNRWSDILSPTRLPTLAGVGETVSHNLSVAKHFVMDRLPEHAPLAELNNGCGKILKVDGEKVAAYRDDDGVLHTLSPVCPHMGCFVQWNGVERSWDCPCHGSRFTAEGSVLNGPAVKGLAPRGHVDGEQEPRQHVQRK